MLGGCDRGVVMLVHNITTRADHLTGGNHTVDAFGIQTKFSSRLDPVGLTLIGDSRQVAVPIAINHGGSPPFGALAVVVARIQKIPVTVADFHLDLVSDLLITMEGELVGRVTTDSRLMIASERFGRTKSNRERRNVQTDDGQHYQEETTHRSLLSDLILMDVRNY